MAPYTPQVDGYTRLLTKVARMYHERGIRQANIASALNISQAKVSRLLKRAVELGIVRTTVLVSPGLHSDLEDALEERFGLREAVVIDTESDDNDAAIISAIGAAAASYLEASLSGNERIGVASWSQTLLALVDRLRPFTTRGADEIVQLLGGIGTPEVQYKAQRLTGDFARMLGAEPVFVQAPGFVADEKTRDSLLNDSALSEATERWKHLTTAIVGVGNIEPSGALAESGNAFPPEERARLLADGAIGDICHHVFNIDGELVRGEYTTRTITIPREQYLAIPRRIGIAGGPTKVDPVLGALRGEWINVLITDQHTARQVINRAE